VTSCGSCPAGAAVALSWDCPRRFDCMFAPTAPMGSSLRPTATKITEHQSQVLKKNIHKNNTKSCYKETAAA
jgi:hypothetical protein